MNINEGNINFRHIIILTTTPTLEDARKICRELVEAMLVACATTVSGVESTFRWKNQVNQEKAFLELLPKINSGTVRLLDNREQTRQLLALERRRGRSGKDSLSHPTAGHDDRGVALAMSVLAAKKRRASFIGFAPNWSFTPEETFERWKQAHRF